MFHLGGDAPARIHASLPERVRFPISGYRLAVAWDASALGDFTFLSLLLNRRMPPVEAVRQARLLSPYIGDSAIDGGAFAPLGLDILERAPGS